MRTTDALKKVIYHEHNVPFKNRLPPLLKNRVSGKGDGQRRAACTQEMFLLFACLKRHEFAQPPCSKELEAFNKCTTTHKNETAKRKADEKAGVLTPGATKLSARSVNLLLKQFKQ